MKEEKIRFFPEKPVFLLLSEPSIVARSLAKLNFRPLTLRLFDRKEHARTH
jgi:hypothetical protein